MPGLEPLLAHVVPFAFVVARMTGLFLFAPMVASLTIPFQVKALLAVIMGAAVYPTVSTQFADVPLDLAGLAPILVSELLIGLCVGVIASVPNTAFDPFMTAILRQVGVALELPFEILTKHFQSSYSAARGAMWSASTRAIAWTSKGHT